MQYSFFRYFLLTYAVCIAPVATAILTNDTISWKEALMLILLIPLGIAAVLAPLFYWLFPKLHKRHRRKKLKKKLFQTFISRHHFSVLEDGYLFGEIDEYVILMHAEYDDFLHQKWVEIQIIFNPKRDNEYIPDAFIHRMIRKFREKEVAWHINCAIIKKQYTLTFPKYEIIYPLLKRCVSELKANRIEPTTYGKWKQMIPETQAYVNKVKK